MAGKHGRSRRRQNRMIKMIVAVLALILIVLLAVLFLIGGKKEETVPEQEEGTESGELLPELETEASDEPSGTSDAEEDPQAGLEEEEGTEVQISTVKQIASETGDTTLGIDVSEFQGNIDWDEVSGSGIDFVMVRAGYRTAVSGEIKEDATARYNLQEAGARGIHLGAYFFSTATTEAEAEEEAAWMKEFLAGYAITYPVAYNCEGFQNSANRHYNLTIDERTRLAEVFLDSMESGGYTGMFYAAKNELADNLMWDADELELRYRMWVAQYPAITYPELPAPEYDGNCAMWQYTNNGTVPGIKAPVDLDVAYFGYSQSASAQEEGAAVHVEADPEVGVTFEEVNEQVTSKDVTNLRSTMDQGDDSNVVAQLKNGETATRTGKGNNGWSRVSYNGETLYAVSSYLTTDLSYQTPAKEPASEFKTQFTTVSENVTAKDVTNLRNRPSVEDPSQVIVQLHNGEVIVRTGISDVGWSRVEYNGQTLYCISSYLQVVE